MELTPDGKGGKKALRVEKKKFFSAGNIDTVEMEEEKEEKAAAAAAGELQSGVRRMAARRWCGWEYVADTIIVKFCLFHVLILF